MVFMHLESQSVSEVLVLTELHKQGVRDVKSSISLHKYIDLSSYTSMEFIVHGLSYDLLG